jgi:hypothetical protein
MSSVIPDGVTHIPSAVSSFSPEKNDVTLADGSKVSCVLSSPTAYHSSIFIFPVPDMTSLWFLPVSRPTFLPSMASKRRSQTPRQGSPLSMHETLLCGHGRTSGA